MPNDDLDISRYGKLRASRPDVMCPFDSHGNNGYWNPFNERRKSTHQWQQLSVPGSLALWKNQDGFFALQSSQSLLDATDSDPISFNGDRIQRRDDGAQGELEKRLFGQKVDTAWCHTAHHDWIHIALVIHAEHGRARTRDPILMVHPDLAEYRQQQLPKRLPESVESSSIKRSRGIVGKVILEHDGSSMGNTMRPY